MNENKNEIEQPFAVGDIVRKGKGATLYRVVAIAKGWTTPHIGVVKATTVVTDPAKIRTSAQDASLFTLVESV